MSQAANDLLKEVRWWWRWKLGGGRRERAAPTLFLHRQAAGLAVQPCPPSLSQLVQLREHETVILVGETGSGKSTQLPQLLLDAGLAGGEGACGPRHRSAAAVAVTQPRRVAAMTVARRVAAERGTPLGGEVGYAIRFADVTSPATRIKYLTDGMLLRECLLDPLLARYGAVVLDEAHERTVQTDVLFGLVKAAQARRRKGGSGGGAGGCEAPSSAPTSNGHAGKGAQLHLPPLRVVVMSATLDAAKFAAYFGAARVVHVRGRQHPVALLYAAAPEASYVDAARCAVLQVHADEAPGDVLVFLTGRDEIEAAARLLADAGPAGAAGPPGAERLHVLPLHASLPADAQARVFKQAPPGHRKVVLATNVAETSVTLAGVRYVVDCGLVKARAFSAATSSDTLAVVPVSQAQARQRAGRAGREAPGKAFRLYTEDTYRALPPVALPEIARVNLAGVVLQLKAMGVDDVLGFDFMDPPPRGALVRAVELLYALGALGPDGTLTRTGHAMARLPVDPKHARVLLAAGDSGCADDALGVVAMAAADNVFVDARTQRDVAAARRARFASPDGDHATLLRVFRAYMALDPSERAGWCAEFFVSPRALRQAADVYAQLRDHLVALRVPVLSAGDDTVPLRRALVAGLFIHAAVRGVGGVYSVAASGAAVAVHPSSVLASAVARSRPPPTCIVFDELLRTTRAYARTVSAVDPSWLPELAPTFFATHRGGLGVHGGAAE